MAQLIVRNLDDQLKTQLTMQAKLKGHSMEEEVRQIIRDALTTKGKGPGTIMAEYFNDVGMNFEIPRDEDFSPRTSFEDT